MQFKVIDVISAAVAINRFNGGFVKSSDMSSDKKPNSKLLYSYFLDSANKPDVVVTNEDVNFAMEIIEYLKGLGFKAIERKLTDFESNVLKLITAEETGKDKIGIAASLPKVYQNKIDQDTWSTRENELASNSQFEGTLHKRHNFELTVENVRYIASVGSSLFCTSSANRNIVKFFNNNDHNFKVGDKINVTGYVKSQEESKYHGGKETMINRIKYCDK